MRTLVVILAPLLQNPCDGPADCTLSRVTSLKFSFAFVLVGTIFAV